MFTRSMSRALVAQRKTDILTTPGIISKILVNLTDVTDVKNVYSLVNDTRYRHEIEPYLRCRQITKKWQQLFDKERSAKSQIESTMCMLQLYDWIHDTVHLFWTFGPISKKRMLKHTLKSAVRLRRQMKYDNLDFDNEFRVYFKNKMRRVITRVRTML